MNNWLLFFSLLFLFIISYRIHGRKFGPSNLLEAVLIVPALLLIIRQDIIQYEMSMATIFIVFSLIVFFQIGEAFILSQAGKTGFIKTEPLFLDINKKYAIAALLIELFFIYVRYKLLMSTGSSYGADNILTAYAANRLNDVQNADEATLPSYYILLSHIAGSIEVVSLHVLLLQKIVFKRPVNWILAAAVLVYFVSLLFDAGRMAAMPSIIHFLYLVLFFSNIPLKAFIKRYFFKAMIFIFSASIVFFLLGALRSKDNIDDIQNISFDPTAQVALYVGSPLVGLDVYVNNGMQTYNYIGEHSLKSIYNILRKVGINTEIPQLHEEKFYTTNLESNVYTGLSYWIKDYSIYGAYTYAMFLGAIFGYVYIYQKRKMKTGDIISCFYVSTMYFALFSVFFNDQFYTLITLDTAFSLICIYVAKKTMVSKYRIIA